MTVSPVNMIVLRLALQYKINGRRNLYISPKILLLLLLLLLVPLLPLEALNVCEMFRSTSVS
jgi:hypothetical protein